METSKLQAIILIGGVGSRMAELTGGRPKCLIDYGGRPFIYTQLEYLYSNGVRNVILCVGYRASDIMNEIGNRYKDLKIDYSIEDIPMGTGGALCCALDKIWPQTMLVMNGDSLITTGLVDLLYMSTNVTSNIIVVKRLDDVDGYGTLDVIDGKVQFHEKQINPVSNLVNTGMYLLNYETVYCIPPGMNVSLEYDIFPITDLSVYYTDAKFIDIGTPERYFKAMENIYARSS